MPTLRQKYYAFQAARVVRDKARKMVGYDDLANADLATIVEALEEKGYIEEAGHTEGMPPEGPTKAEALS